MSLSLKGKTVLVTGSTQGIGHGIALSLASAGALAVYINGRTSESVAKAISSLLAECPEGKFLAAPGDVSTSAGCAQVFAAAPSVDVLVNNAGVFPVKDFFETTDEDWMKLFEINVQSGVRCSRHYLKGMLERNMGRVIFISSESAFSIPPEMIHYGMTKSAQVSVARGLAVLCRGTRVTVNTVLPGPTRTPGVMAWVEEVAHKDGITVEEEVKKLFREGGRATSLKGTFLEVQEIANVVLFVASDLSSASNGAAIRAEGGILNHI
jgi:NAD(P)-dependent dehydrogenase (short-subunit alcohol dehydrogenase family)